MANKKNERINDLVCACCDIQNVTMLIHLEAVLLTIRADKKICAIHFYGLDQCFIIKSGDSTLTSGSSTALRQVSSVPLAGK